MSKEGVVMKCLYGCLVVATLLLWTDHMAGAQENQNAPLVPELIPEDVDGAMEEIQRVLETMGVKALDSVVVLGFTDEGEESMVAFAIKTKQDAAAGATCDIPTGMSCGVDPTSTFPACQPDMPALLIPRCDSTGKLIEWYAGFTDSGTPPPPPKPYSLKYKGSPGSLDCGNNLGGSRRCRQY
jgi:hypothetical protein